MFSVKIKKEIKDHAISEVPNEVNGLILRIEDNYQVYRCKNLSYTPNEHAILSPIDYINAENIGQIVGYYHSQKNSGASLIDNLTSISHNIYSIIYCWENDTFYVIEPNLKNYLFQDFQIGQNDCFSLVKNYYKEELNIELSDYNRGNNWYIKDPYLISRSFENEGFREIDMDDMRLHDVILFGDEDDIVHLAIYQKNKMILHHPRGNKSCIEYLNHHYIKRISKVIRHKNYE